MYKRLILNGFCTQDEIAMCFLVRVHLVLCIRYLNVTRRTDNCILYCYCAICIIYCYFTILIQDTLVGYNLFVSLQHWRGIIMHFKSKLLNSNKQF